MLFPTQMRARNGWSSPRVQPPPYVRVAVDWDHPLSRGLLGYYCWTETGPSGNGGEFAPFITARDISGVGDILGAIDLGSSPVVYSPAGLTMYGRSSGYKVTLNSQQQPTTGASVFTAGYVDTSKSTSGYWSLWGLSNNNGANSVCNIYADPSLNVNFGATVGGSFYSTNFAGLLSTTGLVTFGMTLNPAGTANDARCFRNGSLLGNFATAASTLTWGGIGVSQASGGTANYGFAMGMFWGRALSDTEMAWLNMEPYAMLRVVRRRLWVPAVAATGRARMIQ